MKKQKLNLTLFFIGLSIAALCLSAQCFAQEGDGSFHIPEPGGLALVSTTGFMGWLMRFARKRFLQFKRCFDVAVSVLGIVIAAPIIALAALLIKMVSPGPAFFTQQRVGLSGRIFNMYKLRTMKVDAERETGPVWARDNDPRLIKVGLLLRRTRIDELPQLINVLKGEMSIIGPRPERPCFVESLSREIEDYHKRLMAKPGLTGLAQVKHGYDSTIKDVRRKIKYDLLYIRKMCLWADIQILALTFSVVLFGKGAR